MECNRDEAIRVKGIAQKKMENKDFLTAQRLAAKAQKLYPNLENISQMILVCDVLCSAEKKAYGNEKNWYAILHIEPTADDASIRKQYRKFALSLHPDKNKFAGASDAFKLISEAQKFLLDQEKRILYDSKLKAAGRSNETMPEKQQTSTQSNAQRPQHQNNVRSNVGSQFPNQQNHQFVNNQTTFWTTCPYCSVRYQYYKVVIGKIVVCQNCKRFFSANEVKNPDWTSATNHQPGFPECKESGSPKNSKIGSQGSKKSNSQMATEKNADRQKPPYTKTAFTSNGVKDSKSTKESGNVESRFKESGHFVEPNSRINKKRKNVVRSGVSSSNAEEDVILVDGDYGGLKSSKLKSELHPQRSRQPRKRVSDDANLKADDLQSPLKRSRPNESFHGTAEDIGVHGIKNEVGSSVDVKANEKQVRGNHGCPGKKDSQNGETDVKKAYEKTDGQVTTSSLSSESCCNTIEPEVYQCPDTEFSNFDNDRKEESFAVGQIWAIYDNLDAMPRYYALISKVFSPGFKLRITWLAADPDDDEEIKWVEEGMPTSCGKFKRLKGHEYTEDHPMFSHLVYWEKGRKGSTYMIYPRKGETWAIFKDWDINCHSDPEAKKKFSYEFVEILSDYGDGVGVHVAFLAKMKGFAFVFCRRTSKATDAVLISAKEIFRFSHKIPSFQLTGKEREDVPEGSFELDPASLPTNIDELKAESVGNATQVGMDGAKVESVAGSVSESIENMVNQKEKLAKCSSSVDTEQPKPPVKGDSTPHQAESMSHLHSNQSGSDNLMEDFSDTSASANEVTEVPEQEFYNFDLDKSPDKFQIGQIWAIYSDEDTLPKYYGKIQTISHTREFKLHVKWLEACPQSKDIITWVNDEIPICCGIFKLMKRKPHTLTDTEPFSHLVRADQTEKKDVFVILPRKGEVWALYRNWHAGMRLNDLNDCKYDIVEVVEENDSGLRVMVLEPVDGSKSVFRPQKKGQSNVTVEISRAELLRFSHQVPSFRLTEEKGGRLRGFWELDTAALVVNFSG